MARKAPLKSPARRLKVEPAPAKPAMIPTEQAPPEVIVVRSKRVACDGVGGALGHPRVWLEMGEAAFVECPYCDRRFALGARGAGRCTHRASAEQ